MLAGARVASRLLVGQISAAAQASEHGHSAYATWPTTGTRCATTISPGYVEMSGMGHAAMADDPFLFFVRWAPMLFVVAGVLVVMWLSRQRMPYELQPDVLAALSDTEALPVTTIRMRPPLDCQDVDPKLLQSVLDALCSDGRAVRWYTNGFEHREPLYRRVSLPPAA